LFWFPNITAQNMINIVETAMALIESIRSNENEEKHDMTINER